MSSKRIIGWSIGAIVLLSLVLVGVVAAGVGGEASNLNGFLTQAVHTHAPVDEVKKHLQDMGYDLGSAPAAEPAQTELNAVGPHHSAILYKTWLTVNLKATPDGKATAFNLDRQSSWF